MKTYEEIVSEILDLVNEAVVSSSEYEPDISEYVTDNLMHEAYALGWVINVSVEDVKAIYDGELVKQHVLIKAEKGVLQADISTNGK